MWYLAIWFNGELGRVGLWLHLMISRVFLNLNDSVKKLTVVLHPLTVLHIHIIEVNLTRG